MRALVDLHTHTLASGHAYSTLKENIEEAQAMGLSVLGLSDHAMAMPGTAQRIYFQNFKVIPEQMGSLRILHGVEANIMDYEGGIDVDEKLMDEMDYVIASLHILCVKPGSVEENTAAVLGVMDNPYVKIIGHPDDGRYPLDIEQVVKKAVQNQVVLELNNSSLAPKTTRTDARENNRNLLLCAKRLGAYILMGSDSHICYQIGKFERAEELLRETDFPTELVLNYHPEKLGLVMTPGHIF